MSRLSGDPHQRTRKKSTPSTSASAAQLLLHRGGRAASKDESIEFFSALRKCLPDPNASCQTERGPAGRRGNVRQGGSEELPSPEIGKNDYDWLLTPPATPLCSPATSSVSAAVPNRLARAKSASYAKNNSQLSQSRRENENPPSRLARSSSATHSTVANTPASASSGRSSHVRTSSSSINPASNASGCSTPSGSAAKSPRTPATARRSAAVCQPKGSSCNHGRSAPTGARPRATIPKSTTVTPQQPTVTRRGANAVARSRFASQSTAGSTAQAASPAPHGMRSSTKPRPVKAAVKHCHGNGMAAVSTTTQRWRPSSSPAIAAPQSAPRGNLSEKINVEKVTPHRTSGLASAAVSIGLMKTGSRKSANTDANKNGVCQYEDARHGGAPGHFKPTVVHQQSILSVASRSRLGFAASTSDAGSIARGKYTSEKGQLTAAAAARVADPDLFPSTRYDAMLLREDPKNLT